MQEKCQTKTLEIKKLKQVVRKSNREIERYREKHETKIKEYEDQKTSLENVEEELFYEKAKSKELEQELEK